MKTIKYIISFIAISLFCSCEKEEDLKSDNQNNTSLNTDINYEVLEKVEFTNLTTNVKVISTYKNNKIISRNGQIFEYDKNDNLLKTINSDLMLNYKYDELNRIVSIKGNNVNNTPINIKIEYKNDIIRLGEVFSPKFSEAKLNSTTGKITTVFDVVDTFKDTPNEGFERTESERYKYRFTNENITRVERKNNSTNFQYYEEEVPILFKLQHSLFNDINNFNNTALLGTYKNPNVSNDINQLTFHLDSGPGDDIEFLNQLVLNKNLIASNGSISYEYEFNEMKNNITKIIAKRFTSNNTFIQEVKFFYKGMTN